MAFQLRAEDVLAAGMALPLAAGASNIGRAARVLSALKDAGAVRPEEISDAAGRNPADTLTMDDIMTLRSKYKAKEYPYKDHITRPMLANGAHNSGLNAEMARDAAKMQSLEEHNETLFKYLRPGMTAPEAHAALAKGVKEEKKLPAYWDDLFNRRNFNVRSDAVHGIRVTPDGHIEIKWRGSPDWYTFKKFKDTHEASLEAQRLIMEPSLGRAVYPITKCKDPQSMLSKGLGKWNIKNYDGAFTK